MQPITPRLLALFSTVRLGADLRDALLVAAGFSAFIYLEHWGVRWPAVNTLIALAALWGLLVCRPRSVILAGFFIGLFWFYWVGLSFRYYDMAYAAPLASLGFALGYALIFSPMALTRSPLIRAALFFVLSFYQPFDFNWFLPELLFIHSWLGTQKWQFALILASLALAAAIPHRARFAALLLLVGTLRTEPVAMPPLPPLSIKLVPGTLDQAIKWRPAYREAIVAENFRQIEQAIDEGYDAVVLHESAFPLFLNRHEAVLERLKSYSERIAVVTGALYYESGLNYNVTYRFENGDVRVIKKTVLVPFGEYIPLPALLHDAINDFFFDGAPDYVAAETPGSFTIRGVSFRSAVCYEATRPELFADNPPYMIAISNNAWFTPSIEPTLQRLLMEYFSRQYGTLIFHAANAAGTGVIGLQDNSLP